MRPIASLVTRAAASEAHRAFYPSRLREANQTPDERCFRSYLGGRAAPEHSRSCCLWLCPPKSVKVLAGLVTTVGGVQRVLWHREFHRRSRAGAVSARARLVSRRTATINQIRPFLIEHGTAVRTGANFCADHTSPFWRIAPTSCRRACSTSSLASTRTGCGIVLFSGDGDFPSLVSALQEKTGLIADMARRVAKVPDALTNKFPDPVRGDTRPLWGSGIRRIVGNGRTKPT